MESVGTVTDYRVWYNQHLVEVAGFQSGKSEKPQQSDRRERGAAETIQREPVRRCGGARTRPLPNTSLS